MYFSSVNIREFNPQMAEERYATRAHTGVAVYVAAAAARRSGTHGFGDGDACRSNGCAPPGPTKASQPASTGIGVSPFLFLSSAKERDLKKKDQREGKTQKDP